MKTIKNYEDGTSLELYSATALFAGYGHKKITVKLCYSDEYKQFTSVTNNMPAYDDAMDIEDYEEKQIALYHIIANSIEDDVISWMLEVDEPID